MNKRICKSVVSFVVLHEEEINLSAMSLNNIVECCDLKDGAVRGRVKVESNYGLIPTEEVLQAELQELGNNGTFFNYL